MRNPFNHQRCFQQRESLLTGDLQKTAFGELAVEGSVEGCEYTLFGRLRISAREQLLESIQDRPLILVRLKLHARSRWAARGIAGLPG